MQCAHKHISIASARRGLASCSTAGCLLPMQTGRRSCKHRQKGTHVCHSAPTSEQLALESFTSSAGRDSTLHLARTLLFRAADHKDVATDTVYGAMLCVEQQFKQSGPKSDWLPQLDGAWQLVFSAPNKAIPAWSYIPVNEDAVFDAKRGITSLASDLGPFHFDFIGDFSWDEACQVMEFGFTKLHLDAFGRRVLERPFTTKRKTYSYFLLEEGTGRTIACARSSAGSLTLMRRRS